MAQKAKLFFLILLIASLSGCSGQGNADTEEFSEEKRNVAMWDTGSISGESILSPMLMGDNLYYWKGDWDHTSRRWSDSSVFKKAGGETEAVEITALGDSELIYFLVDEDYNLYTIYAEYEGEDKFLFFRKQSKDGVILTDVPVAFSQETPEEYQFMNQNGYILTERSAVREKYASGAGEGNCICLMKTGIFAVQARTDGMGKNTSP